MWVIFLLAVFTTAIIALIFAYVAHRVIMAIENDRTKNKKRKKNKK